MRNGDADGIPPLPSRAAKQHWEDVLLAAYDDFCAEVDAADARDGIPRSTPMPPRIRASSSRFWLKRFSKPGPRCPQISGALRAICQFFHFDPLA